MAPTPLNTFLQPTSLDSSYPSRCLSRLFLGLAVLTLFLMALGSATRVMNAGLSCPDWPLCYGQLIPKQQMNLQVFLEWFHRLIASSIGLIMIALTALSWRWRSQLETWVPVATAGCLGLVILQGVLGGLTVTELLRFDIVTAHLATGLLFFSSLLIMASRLIPYQGTGVVGRLPWVSSAAVACLYLQNVLGGLVASQWSAHQCLAGEGCQVMYNHLGGVIPSTAMVLVLVIRSWRTPALHPRLRFLSQLAAILLVLQVLLGISTLYLHLQVVWLTVAHQSMGASLLGTLVVFSVIAGRDRNQALHLPAVQTTAPSIGLEPS